MVDLSTNDARLALAKKYAAKYSLNAAIVCAVIEQESAWYPWAYRYEPGFFQKYITPLALQSDTEAHARAASFGLMQVLGQVAREHGFTGASLLELCNPDTGVDYGCKKLRKCFDAHPNDAESALLEYNGGGNAFYGKQVLGRVARYEAMSEGAGV